MESDRVDWKGWIVRFFLSNAFLRRSWKEGSRRIGLWFNDFFGSHRVISMIFPGKYFIISDFKWYRVDSDRVLFRSRLKGASSLASYTSPSKYRESISRIQYGIGYEGGRSVQQARGWVRSSLSQIPSDGLLIKVNKRYFLGFIRQNYSMKKITNIWLSVNLCSNWKLRNVDGFGTINL